MKRNMDATFGLIYSQHVMLMLIEKGMTREAAYDLVQPLTAKSWDEQVMFRPLLEENEQIRQYLNDEDIDKAFDYNYHLTRVDEIFDRVFD
jgi:adenylosuccinate lyase